MSRCGDPILCYTSDSSRQFRHFSLSTPTFKALAQQVFNCGSCEFCRKRRSMELALRCVLHASLYKQNCFLTLTYDESLPGYHNEFQYSDIQKFKKKLRRHCEYHFKKKIQVFNVHEYGKNGKKHWHLVVFNHDFSTEESPLVLYTVRNGNKLFTSSVLDSLWSFGFSTIGNVTEASAMYQAQYTQKDFKNGNSNNSKRAHSRHSGIGRDYFLAQYNQILRLGYVPFQGRKAPIPRYFLKLAHKHFSHFYEQSNFFDLPYRKALYRPFKDGEANKEIADLYGVYSIVRKEFVAELSAEWEAFLDSNLFSTSDPDFKLSYDNYLYDLKNKISSSDF